MEAVRGSNVFEVRNYRSLRTRLNKANNHVSSATFEAGGFEWRLRCYPNVAITYDTSCVSVYLELVTPGAAVRASAELSLVPWTGGGVHRRTLPSHKYGQGSSMRGLRYFVDKIKLEKPTYLRGDSFKIKCCVTVYVKRPPPSPVTVPPSELATDLRKLLDLQSAPPADVLILVGAESFAAHSLVLWMRCPELHGRITASSSITISESDVQPSVFRTLLHYIYTESLPAMDGLTSAQKAEKLRGLPAAAIRYKVHRLKLFCENALCTSFHATTVIATLAVAEQLQLPTLRDSCIKFIASSKGRIQ